MLKVLLKTENGITEPIAFPKNTKIVDLDCDDDVQRIDYSKDDDGVHQHYSYLENPNYETQELEDVIYNQFVVVWKVEDVLRFDSEGWLTKEDAKEILETNFPEYTTEIIQKSIQEMIEIKKQKNKRYSND